MNIPKVAYQTFIMLKNNSLFEGIYRIAGKIMRKNIRPEKKAQWIHNEVDKQIAHLFEDQAVARHVSCRQGCNACCHSQVSVIQEEADLLAMKVQKGLKIDWERLEKQALAGNDAAKWYQIPYKVRACVFLSDSGMCRVYEDRPSVCRTNFVVGDPADCSTEDGQLRPVSLLKTYRADMVIAAQFQGSAESGTLPMMLVKALNQRLQVFNRKEKR